VKILYVSQYFPPEMGAPAARASELSSHWARLGHDVTVLTGFPNHPTGIVPYEWRARFHRLRSSETADGVRVVRTWLWPLPNRKAHERIRNYSSFCLSAAVSGLTLERPDVVIGTSPQLLCALAGWWIAFTKRVPFVFEVRDLWPESLAAVGASEETSLLHAALGAIAGFLYRRADRIVIVSPAFRERLTKFWKVPEDKISLVANGVETDLFRFDSSAPQVREQLGLEGRFLICYIGTMGNAHGLETLLSAAEQLQSAMPRATFLLIGEGAEKENLVRLAAKRKLKNVCFLGEQERGRIPAYISAADLCLVLLKKTELFKTVIPTKLLEYMACERPVVAGVDGETRRIVELAGAGVFVEPENSMALVKAILDLAKDKESRGRMGVRARQYIVSHLSREKTARDYIGTLETLRASARETDPQAGGREVEETVPRTGT
jgi:colanic acid biosynthesis glycosyl transferase WcaI